MTIEFVVSADKRKIVVRQLAKVRDLFNVRVQYEDAEGSGGDSGCIVPPVSEAEGEQSPVWVRVDGEGDKPQKAKEYILSVCSDNTVEDKYDTAFLNMLDTRIPDFEYQSGAVIERVAGDRLRIRGCDMSIAKAKSLISGPMPSLVPDTDRYSDQDSGVILQNGAIPGSVELGQSNTATSIRDMSDSFPSLSVNDHHRSTRTGSDTTMRHASPPSLNRTDVPLASSLDLEAKAIPTDVPYSHRREEIMEYTQKLGFKRQEVDQVLAQLGPTATNNDVMQMLVSMGSSKPDLDAEKEVEESSPGGGLAVRDVSDGVPEAEEEDPDPYRPIIIDGSNVAMSYGNKNVFACKGIDTVVMWFLKRGHKVVYVFVPSWRKEQSKPETPITDQEVLIELEQAKILIWTPSRRVKGRRVVCYDDRYILNLALELNGIVVSNDTFRDLCSEKPEYRKVVEERLLMYSFVGDKFMPPDDPLGRHGPSLDNFLRKTPAKPSHQMQLCPYGKKCTYGNKCKYSHPERPKHLKPTSEILQAKSRQRKDEKIKADLQARAASTTSLPVPWGGDVSSGSATVPLGNPARLESRGTVPLVSAPTEHGATVPLMKSSPKSSSINTYPLAQSRDHRMHHVPGPNSSTNSAMYGMGAMPPHGAPHQNYKPVSEMSHSWSEQRVPPYHGAPVDHQLPLQHPRVQQLPNRAMQTAPITGYTPQPVHQQHRDASTAPLSAPGYQHPHHSTMNKRYSLPSGTRSSQGSPSSSSQYHSDRNGAMPEFAQEFSHLSLQDSSHNPVSDDDRHYSYPLSGGMYHGSPTTPHGLMRQHSLTSEFDSQALTSTTEDEGYYSPRLNALPEHSVFSPGLVPHNASGFPMHQTGRNEAGNAPSQSHSYDMMYPGSASAATHSTWSQHPLPPKQGMGLHHGPPASPSSPLAGVQHGRGARSQMSGQHPAPHAHPSEPVTHHAVWSDANQERLAQTMRQYPKETDPARILEYMRRGSSGQ